MAAAGAATMRYQQICLLASGGMAELHLARSTGPGGFERLVVVKRLLSGRAVDPGAAQALLDEARLAALLSHVNIVQVLDVGLHEGGVQIVMEYLHGHDVADLLRAVRARKERLSLDAAVAITLAVTAGLHHAHEQLGPDGQPLEIVHRDISPENVFVTYDGGVKLIDFGIAQGRLRLGKTTEGLVKGKPGYMAPEQVQGRRLDRRTDVYLAALLLYELTTGERCFTSDNAYDLLSEVVEREPRWPSEILPDYPPALEAIVLQGLSRDRERRQPTAQVLQKQLEAFARERRLDVSQFALAALMERVFADEIEAWKNAKRQGRSLAEHVAGVRRATPPLPRDRVPLGSQLLPTASGRTGARRLLWGGALLVLLVAVSGLVVWARRGGEEPKRLPTPAKAASPPASAAVAPPTPSAPAAIPDASPGPARPLQAPSGGTRPRKQQPNGGPRRRPPPDVNGALPR